MVGGILQGSHGIVELLPESIRTAKSLHSFKRMLKTHVFDLEYVINPYIRFCMRHAAENRTYGNRVGVIPYTADFLFATARGMRCKM